MRTELFAFVLVLANGCASASALPADPSTQALPVVDDWQQAADAARRRDDEDRARNEDYARQQQSWQDQAQQRVQEDLQRQQQIDQQVLQLQPGMGGTP